MEYIDVMYVKDHVGEKVREIRANLVARFDAVAKRAKLTSAIKEELDKKVLAEFKKKNIDLKGKGSRSDLDGEATNLLEKAFDEEAEKEATMTLSIRFIGSCFM